MIEWAIFRKHDGADATPVENFRYTTSEAAQRSIERGYNQSEHWEPRGRFVGQWSTDPIQEPYK